MEPLGVNVVVVNTCVAQEAAPLQWPQSITVTLNTALEHEDLTYKVTGPLLDLLWESLYAFVHLLDAWWDQQPGERPVGGEAGDDAKP